jgi:hypothetical protein
LTDPESQPDEKRPDQSVGTGRHPAALPELVFKPDVRQTVHVARVRMYTLLAGVAVVIVALAMMLSYRPQARPSPAAVARPAPPAESTASAPVSADIQRPPGRHEASAVEAARLAASTIDTLVDRANEKWLRATELTPQGSVTSEKAEDVAVKLRKAAILADSARRDIALARQQAEVVFRASRDAKSGSAFRLSVLYDAVDRYVKSIAADADDRYSYYSKSEVSVKAVLMGDQAESEIQQNVAMSFLRRSEERQSSVRRLAQQVREALRNIDNAGR